MAKRKLASPGPAVSGNPFDDPEYRRQEGGEKQAETVNERDWLTRMPALEKTGSHVRATALGRTETIVIDDDRPTRDAWLHFENNLAQHRIGHAWPALT
jgi:hypothetical protein